MLWVASSGGHFAQLNRIAKSVEAHTDSKWLTFNTPQTKQILDGQNVHYVDYIAPRDGVTASKAALWALRNLRRGMFDVCVSTGAAIAPAILPMARLCRYRTVYVESVTRVHGPSLSGAIIGKIPGIETYTQHEAWSDSNWKYKGSILDSWVSNPNPILGRPRKIFVTVGSIRPYRFDRAIDAVLKILAADDEVVWQLGATKRTDLPGEIRDQITPAEFLRNATEADVVITHAGVGTVMEMLDLNIAPVIVVRDPNHSEHVDGHQQQIATELIRRGLAFELDLENPDRYTVDQAYTTKITSADLSSV
ncbi:glycosyltransferase [Rhodococcoides yunnanense]|uniref:glycosyltransferase n=1 Tax=Rhodococcoides yunnanense TaxID=278209 RepID=UPI001474052E|nr:glycosyltransferase [Rhodococcus yunnanensis]